MRHFLHVEFPTNSPGAVSEFIAKHILLQPHLLASQWRLVAACSSITGVALPPTIVHVWEVPDAGSRLDEHDPNHGKAYTALLKFCGAPTQHVLEATPYSPAGPALAKKAPINYFLDVDIRLIPGKEEAFNKSAGPLLELVKDQWELIIAGSTVPPEDPPRIIHLWRLTSANAVAEAMVSFAEHPDYTDLTRCCQSHAQQIFTSLRYNPLGKNTPHV